MQSKYDAIFEELTSHVAEGHLDVTATIPEFLTPERALEIHVKAARAHAHKLNEVWQKSMQSGDWDYFVRLISTDEVVAAK